MGDTDATKEQCSSNPRLKIMRLLLHKTRLRVCVCLHIQSSLELLLVRGADLPVVLKVAQGRCPFRAD